MLIGHAGDAYTFIHVNSTHVPCLERHEVSDRPGRVTAFYSISIGTSRISIIGQDFLPVHRYGWFSMTALSISLNITVSDSITITVTGQVTGQMCLARVDKHSITTLKSLKQVIIC